MVGVLSCVFYAAIVIGQYAGRAGLRAVAGAAAAGDEAGALHRRPEPVRVRRHRRADRISGGRFAAGRPAAAAGLRPDRRPAGAQPAHHRQPDERSGDHRHRWTDSDVQSGGGHDHRCAGGEAVGESALDVLTLPPEFIAVFGAKRGAAAAAAHGPDVSPQGRPADRPRAEHGGAADAARRNRLPVDLPGRHRSAPPRTRSARTAAAGGRRRAGRRHRPRDPQPAGVDGRVGPDPAAGAAAHARSVAADGHRAARVGTAQRDDPQLPRLRPPAAPGDVAGRRATRGDRRGGAAREQSRAERRPSHRRHRAGHGGLAAGRRGAAAADRLEPGDQRPARDGAGWHADAVGGRERRSGRRPRRGGDRGPRRRHRHRPRGARRHLPAVPRRVCPRNRAGPVDRATDRRRLRRRDPGHLRPRHRHDRARAHAHHARGAARRGFRGESLMMTDRAWDTALQPAAETPPLARILVVDDELGIRVMLAAALKREGYEVLLASDGRERARRARRRPGRCRRDRHPHAAHDRDRAARRGQADRSGAQRHHDDRLRLEGYGARRAAARRHRLRREGGQAQGRVDAADPQGARPQAPPAGERAAQADARHHAPVLEHHRLERCDGGAVRPDRADRADQQHRARRRRVGHRQGAGRPRDPFQLARGRIGRSSR